jgi:hypothetical protein
MEDTGPRRRQVRLEEKQETMKTSMIGRMTATLAVVVLAGAGVARASLVWDSPLSLPSTDSTTWNVNTTIAAFDVAAPSGVGNVGTVSWGGLTWTRLANTDPANGGVAVTVGGITYTDSNYHGDGSSGRYGGIPVLDDLAGGADTTSNTYVLLSGFDSAKTYQVQFFTALTFNGWRAKIFGLDGVGNSGYSTLGGNYAVFSGTLSNATSLKVQPRLSSGGTDDGSFTMTYYSGVRIAEVIPEPASGLMLLGSMLGLGVLRRKLRG